MVFVQKESSGDLGKRSKKRLKTVEANEEYQIMVANMDTLREVDGMVHANVVQMLEHV